jgi:hypothetical protein
MFDMYDIEGRRFRNTLENLRKVRKIRASAETLLWSNRSEVEIRPVPGTAGVKTGAPALSSKAVQAYREIRHLNRR